MNDLSSITISDVSLGVHDGPYAAPQKPRSGKKKTARKHKPKGGGS